MKAVFLDNEEKDLLGSYDRDEWRPVKHPKKEIKKLKEYARDTLKKHIGKDKRGLKRRAGQ